MSVSTPQTTLPDPNNNIHDSGHNAGGSNGPGFASITLTSEQKVMKNRTNSGALVARMASGHLWRLQIKYNPLTRDEFEPVANFLIDKRGSLNPFFVSLPNHLTTRNSTFNTYTASNTIEANADTAAGQTSIMMKGFSGTDYNNSPKPGDIFNMNNGDPTHTKVYKVTKVETNDKYMDQNKQPTTTQRLVHFIPPLTKAISVNDDINFNNPKIRVVLSNDNFSYDLSQQNLYSFNLDLEEAHA